MTTVEDLITSCHRQTFDALETYTNSLGQTLGREGGARCVMAAAATLLAAKCGPVEAAAALRSLADQMATMESAH